MSQNPASFTTTVVSLSYLVTETEVRETDYARPDTLARAFAGVDRLLLISSSENGKRRIQHRNVVDAARQAGVGFIAYTSILHADTSPLFLAEEHRDTETAIVESGVS